MKKRTELVLSWALVLAVAAAIFFFSAQDGAASTRASDGIVYSILRLFHPDYDGLSSADKQALYDSFQLIVRKAAHFTEFAALGFSLRQLMRALERRFPLFWSWSIGTLYAVTDELHQRLISARTARWQDVCIDSAGVLFGALMMALILFLRKRRKEKKTPDPA